jgi:DNA-binding transcriptional ArsR family regulator
MPELSRFAVMQHLGVLTAAGVVITRRRGRDRVNYFNPVPLRECGLTDKPAGPNVPDL